MTRQVQHPRSGARISVPDGWEILCDEESDTLVALEPGEPGEPGTGFRANLVLSVVANGDLSFRDWQVATDATLPEMLTDYQLLDLEKLDVAGRPGGRRLAHHVSPDGVPLTMEQWFTAVGGTGYTLTATVDSWRYDELADVFADLARRLEIPQEGSS